MNKELIEKIEKIKAVRNRLKRGEYNGNDIMQAWIAIDELIKCKSALAQQQEDYEELQSQYHFLASEMVYEGNSVQHWRQKALAYKECAGVIYELKSLLGVETPADVLEQVKTQQQEADQVDWSAFPAYLIDHYEGRVLYEELLQEALSDMLRDPEYHPPKPTACLGHGKCDDQGCPAHYAAQQETEVVGKITGFTEDGSGAVVTGLAIYGMDIGDKVYSHPPAAQPQVPDYEVVEKALRLFRKEFIGQDYIKLWESCWLEAEEKSESAAKEEGR